MFFIINKAPMCIFYTREINLKPYFLDHTNVCFGVYAIPKRIQVFFPSLNCYFVSADVTFNESSFYYKSSSHSTESPSNTVDFPNPINILMICDIPGVPCMPSVSVPPPLQVYSHRHRPQQPASDSPQVPTTMSPPGPTTKSPFPPSDHSKKICSWCISPSWLASDHAR